MQVPAKVRIVMNKPTKFLLCRLALPFLAIAATSSPALTEQQDPVRARDLGIPFEGTPGPFNAITDVGGVTVGQVTLVEGNEPLPRGKGPVRTGVTAILPRGRESGPVFSSWFAYNGHGELTGTAWIDELGWSDGPIIFTDAKAVGVAVDALLRYEFDRNYSVGMPVVGETWSGALSDITGFHVRKEHVYEAVDKARSGPVAEGAVGGGTGTVCNGWKGGIGTSSRLVKVGDKQYTVGVLVQCNYGLREQLVIAGKPLGRLIAAPSDHYEARFAELSNQTAIDRERASIVIAIATDAPLLPFQLKRVAKRASAGMARVGAVWQHGSGDLFLSFSTANEQYFQRDEQTQKTLDVIETSMMAPLLEGVVQATEEAIVNSMVLAETMTGVNDRTVYALPHEELRAIFNENGSGL